MFSNSENQRNLLFNLCGAFERDLCYLINYYLVQDVIEFDELVPLHVQKKAKSSFDLENLNQIEKEEIVNNIPMGESLNILKKFYKNLPEEIHEIFNQSFNSTKKMVGIRNRVCHYHEFSRDDLETYRHFCETHAFKNNEDFPQLSELYLKIQENPNFAFTKHYSLNGEMISHNLPSPDYYDTGFIGRNSYLKKIDKVIKSNQYPILTIHGEGGIGKTALTLRYLYQLIDNDSGGGFDQIHWETAKTKKLSANEILNISNEIDDFKKMISSSEININKESDVIDSVVEYLSTFKILLILDNIETVRDKFLDEFIEKFSLIETKSKVIFTSRQALQNRDLDIRIVPFEPNEAQFFFRKLVNEWDVKNLKDINQSEIDKYIQRYNYNPLFIKSFIECVRNGDDPNIVISNKTDPLTFAFENMYSNLNPETFPILEALLIKDTKRTAAYLSVVTEKDYNNTIDALVDLEKKNFIEKNYSNIQQTELFKFTPISREYLVKFHKIDSKIQRKLLEKEKIISIDLEKERNEVEQNPYNWDTIVANNSEEVLTKRLLNVIYSKMASLRGYLKDDNEEEKIIELKEEILNLFEKTIKITPNYFEIYKAKALYYKTIDDLANCNESYELAVSLNSNWSPILTFYGWFLIIDFNDVEKGIRFLEKALEYDSHPEVVLKLAKAYTYVNRFEDSENLLVDLVENLKKHPFIVRKKIIQSFLDNKRRLSEQAEKNDDFDQFVEIMNELINIFTIYEKNIDEKTRYSIVDKSRYQTTKIMSRLDESESSMREEISKILDWIETNATAKMKNHLAKQDIKIGKVTKVFFEKQVASINEYGEIDTSTSSSDRFFAVLMDLSDNEITYTFVPSNLPKTHIYNLEILGKDFIYRVVDRPNTDPPKKGVILIKEK